MSHKKILFIALGIFICIVIAGTVIFLKNNSAMVKSDTLPGLTLFYPKEWKETSYLVGEGVRIVIKPASLSADDFSPSFIMQKVDSAAVPSAQREKMFKALGYTKQEVTINNQQVTRYSGVFSPKEPGEEPYYSDEIFYPLGADLYSIDCRYNGVKKDPEVEKTCNEIMSSVKLN